MRTPAGAYVPLADVVTVQSRTGFSTVRRENGVRLINVTGDISEDDPARAEAILQQLREDILPTIASEKQVEWRLAGLAEQEDEFLNDARTGLILCLSGIYLVLAWVFSSWTRPMVVMAIIPFGLVGTIFGHNLHDVPLSMFTVVGLLGMTGIIINDSIVLVTTIDEHAKDRGVIPSIIDGAADRLRPVFLTTATTVLGLAPLLFERSAQAQFLKPTVITLVYGLGFGMLLVLIVVPALMAIQSDFARQVQAFGRARRARRLQGALLLSGAVLTCWLVMTMGWMVLQGQMHPLLGQIVPALAGVTTPIMALLVFILGAGLVCVLGYGAAAVRMLYRARRSGASV